ncbi:transposase [Desulfobacter hydrogenophilus]|uniref:Transposase n=2 Tax=Desulfobacter hydrogenophilus TaxID=2291 RepID=A0A328F5M0_9BACT|nr:transposase [Desulfobacter hydrogenophilus]NDY74634.1 transposase [Desulfobacter hydrogenophilus]QBH11947.1 transposase [Desulfobacter hydrogenophilus]QBH13413.1 transposase [Desulfobacter hydrogenophilus]QBH14432.1 transposase [Desulfobacter hydrogenophilus]QBH14482.1 transposase [Desulfobacter hydrogenophilus]
MKVLKTRKKNVVTLDIGAFCAKETVLVNPIDNTVHQSQQLRSLTPYRCTYGYDVLVFVGYGLFVHCLSEQQIIALLSDRNITISQREIGFLGKKFIAYLAIAHQQAQQRLNQLMSHKGGYILHIDGTCEGGSPHLFTGMDGIAQIVLDNIKLPSEKAESIIPFLERIKKQYGNPVALVHDMGKGILSAVEVVFKGIPDFICHFHFLRDIGKDLYEAEYAKIRIRLTKHKIRTVLRAKAKALDSLMGNDTQLGTGLLECIAENQPNTIPAEKLAIVSSYVMIHWALDTTGQLEGYGFPFDCPHFIFYQRLKVLYKMVDTSGYNQFDKHFFNLWKPLNKIINDQQLRSAAKQIEKKMETFKQLRTALSITVSENKKGLNDDGDNNTNIKRIAQKVKRFRAQIMADPKLSQTDSYKKMIKQIDTYWEKLFADPITIETSNGQQVHIQPQRTNNILERFFRELKRRNRKRSGTISLNKRLKTMLTDTPLIKNLDKAEYMEAILDGNATLEERFEKIDYNMVLEKLNDEQKTYGKISPEMKKIIQRPDLPKKLASLFAT